jgi:Protein of unknown function (DUF1579)
LSALSRNLRCIPLLVVLGCWPAASAPLQSPPLDGPNHPFDDSLMDKLAGKWKLSGMIAHQKAEHSVEAEWVLNHQFLRIHEKALGPGEGGRLPYEVMAFIGYDNASERYVAHWIDIFGGRVSETLGYGTKRGNAVEFVFEYPDGPFHTTFQWHPETTTWEWVMRQKNETGQWVIFGEMTLAKTPQ